MHTMRQLIMLVEARFILDERARSEMIRTADAPIYINPSPAMLAKLLRPPSDTDESKLRVLAIGDDIAVADAYSYRHQDIWDELRDIAHPMAQEGMGLDHLHLNAVRQGTVDPQIIQFDYPWRLSDLQVRVVAEDNESQLPRNEWNDGLRRALPLV